MMNGVALFLVITSIVTGSIWSPPAHEKNSNSNPNVILKEGHQFVVVEYDQEGDYGTTKILISPHQHHEIDSSKEEIISANKFGPRELVCDALGKCKNKIAGVFEKVEEQTKEGVTKGVDRVKQVVDEGSAKIEGAYEKVKQSDIMNKPKSPAKDDIENYVERKDVVGEGRSIDKDAYEKVKETNLVDGQKRAHDIEGNVTTEVGWVKGFVQKVAKSGISKLKECKENGNGLEEMAEKVADDTKEGAHRMTDAARKAGGLASDGLKDGTRKVDETISKIRNKRMEDLKEKVSYLGRSDGMKLSVGVVHLVAFSVAFGMSVWMTFVSTYILEGVLPRQQFGRLQSKIYPVYFKVQAYSVAVVFLVHLVGRKSLFVINSWELFHVINILVALMMSLVNLLYLEPRATEVMSLMLKLEKVAGRERVISQRTSVIADDDAGKSVSATTERQEQVPQFESQNSPLIENLRRLNGLSSYINLVTLISLSLHLVYLGQRI